MRFSTRRRNRELIEQVALDLGVPFTGIWLDASPSLLMHRVIERTGGASDADVDILESQIERGAGAVGMAAAWMRANRLAELVREIRRPEPDDACRRSGPHASSSLVMQRPGSPG